MWQVVSRCGGQSLLHIVCRGVWGHALPVYIVATLLIRAIKFILCRELAMTANRTVQERNAICRIVDSAESLTCILQPNSSTTSRAAKETSIPSKVQAQVCLVADVRVDLIRIST